MSTGGGGDSEVTVRYYSGIEDMYNGMRHLARPVLDDLYLDSPFTTGYDVMEPDDAYFAAGYVISDFPSLYDMFGKFMAGLDIEVLRSQIQMDFITGTVSEQLKSTNRILLNDETDSVILPKLKASFQNMNAVMASSFIDAQATVYSNQTKRINEYNANIDMKMLDLATQWAMKHLEWNTEVIHTYEKMINDYYQLNANYLNHKATLAEMDKMWPFRVFDQYRALVGCLNGAQGAQQSGSSDWSKAMSGIVGGASFLASPTGNWMMQGLGLSGGLGVGAGAAGASTSAIMDSAALASEAAGWEAFASAAPLALA
jgi:hypothetical protein